MIVGGIFGPKKSGKTTLAHHLGNEYWQQEGRRCLVNDPNFTDKWGANFWVAPNEDEFWIAAWSTKNCLLICDDAGKTIDRDDALTDVFTRINHNGHKLLVVGHNGVNLNPTMREQMDVLYLFRTTPTASKKWYEIFGNDELKDAHHLGRYEFYYARQYEGVQKLKLDLAREM